ncbi:hypothetical protein D3C72_2002570 [compost metagenome]
MPVAMPTLRASTTLTAMASIKPQGRPMPQPINNMGIHRPAAPAAITSASQIKPAATASRPMADSRPGRNQRVSSAARNGTTSKGAARPIINCPASSAL